MSAMKKLPLRATAGKSWCPKRLNGKPTICFTRDDGKSYRLAIESLCSYLARRQVAPLLGAGVSIDAPANLLGAKTLVESLQNVLRESAEPVLSRFAIDDPILTAPREVLNNARLEKLLDVPKETHGADALDHISVLNGQHWNSNHATIARLAADDHLPACVTLNFDLLIELALSEGLGSGCETICPLLGKSFRVGESSPTMTLVKPHGSFVPPTVGSDPYEYVTTTLSEIGSYPSKMNRRAFERVFSQHRVLLVAGYSDDDWDIFPILQDVGGIFDCVVWIQYAKDALVTSRSLPDTCEEPALHTRILPWLRSLKCESVLIVGRSAAVFGEVARRMRKPITLPKGETLRGDLSVDLFRGHDGPLGETMIRTAVSFAILLQNSGEFNRVFLRWLLTTDVVSQRPALLSRVEKVLSHTEYTDGYSSKARKHMRLAIRLHKRAHSYLAEEYAFDLLWLGYEHLSSLKRPSIQWLIFPWHFFTGLHLLIKAKRTLPQESRSRQRLESLVEFYAIDLWQSWVNLLFLCGPRATPVLQRIFKPICERYAAIVGSSDGFLEQEYYWLRHIEAILLAGQRPDRQVLDEKLKRLEFQYRLTQNSVQMGNVHAYSALVEFCYAPDSEVRKNAIRSNLDLALSEWRKNREVMASGWRRVVLFDRLFGGASFIRSLIRLITRRM